MINKIHIVLVYYRRPKIVLNALHSIENSSYKNYILTIIDDSGNEDFKDIINSTKIDQNKINYVPILDSEYDKNNQGGSRHGYFINQNIKNKPSDIVVILCDDDALEYRYLEYLDQFYTLNPDIMWSYCNLYFYNPLEEFYLESNNISSTFNHPGSTYDLNKFNYSLNPAGQLDSSQISFKTSVFDNINVGYPSPQTRGLDFYLFNTIYKNFGDCYPNSYYGQYKGTFPDQLGNRWIDKQNEFKLIDN
jgi:uncharacterized protein YrzB (UPF0473 family)